MATLVLTTVGGIVGGPIGAALGGLIGQAADRALLAPKGRQGPRLTELAVQTSSYGTPIPRAYGTMRLAGSVIWATDLEESSHRSGGKGQPATTTYSYSASFAVALSARPIVAVRRIWADGKLLRGAAGDFKGEGAWRLHRGGEDQAADPLIASLEEDGLAPAHRGVAYAVFEDLQLADFGNRIPSLTFGVVADEAPVTVAAIAREMSGGTIDGDEAALTLGGFAASGDAVRGVAELLAEVSGGWFAPRAGGVTLRAGVPAATLLAGERAREDGDVAPGRTAPLDTVPRSLAVAHYDPARDYQTGVQRARRPGAGRRDERLDLPAAVAAGEAKAIAEAALRAAAARRRTRRVATGFAGLAVRAGGVVALPGEDGAWRVTRSTLENGVVALDLVPVTAASPTRTAAAGRPLAAADVAAGRTVLVAVELPRLDGVTGDVPQLTVLATGTGQGWRGADLLYSIDGGTSWLPGGRSGSAAVIGTVIEAAAGSATLVDEMSAIVVVLARPGDVLGDAGQAALDAGANLALVGDELLQFGRAAPMGDGRWRLTGLLRGRGGSEAAIGAASPGSRFALIDTAGAATIVLPVAALGAMVQVMASGRGDAEPASVAVMASGASVLPPSPVRGIVQVRADGGVDVSWTRRSRAGWAWTDGGDVPLGEEDERYRVQVAPVAAPAREEIVTVPRTEIGAGERPATVEIRQIGRNGASPALTIAVS